MARTLLDEVAFCCTTVSRTLQCWLADALSHRLTHLLVFANPRMPEWQRRQLLGLLTEGLRAALLRWEVDGNLWRSILEHVIADKALVRFVLYLAEIVAAISEGGLEISESSSSCTRQCERQSPLGTSPPGGDEEQGALGPWETRVQGSMEESGASCSRSADGFPEEGTRLCRDYCAGTPLNQELGCPDEQRRQQQLLLCQKAASPAWDMSLVETRSRGCGACCHCSHCEGLRTQQLLLGTFRMQCACLATMPASLRPALLRALLTGDVGLSCLCPCHRRCHGGGSSLTFRTSSLVRPGSGKVEDEGAKLRGADVPTCPISLQPLLGRDGALLPRTVATVQYNPQGAPFVRLYNEDALVRWLTSRPLPSDPFTRRIFMPTQFFRLS